MSEYAPRLTDSGILNNPLWYSNNPFYQSGNGLPNCTCYAWGRFWEIANGDPDKRPTLSLGNGEDWFGYTADGYERGNTPALGAVLCLANGPYSGLGHVCVVEQINPDGSIITSNSAYNGAYFYLETRGPGDYGGVYDFQGFIYNPYAGDTPGPGPTPGKGFKWWMAKRILEKRKN